MNASIPKPHAKSRIFLSPPHMGSVELAFIEEAFRTNFIAPVGPHVDAFEREFTERFGFKHAAAVSSGTAAIHLSLRLLGVKPGDEIVCSTFTFAASANPILYEQAKPVFIDSDEATWNMDPLLLEAWLDGRAKIGRIPKAVIAVDLYGQCADMERIAAVCKKHGVALIEDAAEALGATFAGRPAGSFGKTGIFSFNGNKIITTSGGGMLVSDDGELIKKARFLATQARDAAQHYQHTQLGFNYRMSNVLAGIGRAQIQVLPERVEARRRNFARYHEGLGDLPGLVFMPEAPRSYSNRWLTCMTIDPTLAGISCEQVRRALEEENIEARLTWKPLHLQPVFAECETVGGKVSERLFNHGLCLPSGSAMTEDDCERVIDVVRAAFPQDQLRPRSKAEKSFSIEIETPELLDQPGQMLREKMMAASRWCLGWSDRTVGRSPAMRFTAVLAIYAAALSAVFWLSYQMRWDFEVPENFQLQLQTLLLPVIVCKLALLWSFGQFRSVLSYYGLVDFGAVVLSMSSISGIMLGLWYMSEVSAAPPRGIILMDLVLSVAAVSAYRLSLRIMRTWSVSGQKRPGTTERQVAVVGTGQEAQAYVKSLLQRRGCGSSPVFFVDEDVKLNGRSIHGLRVYAPLEKLTKLAARTRVDELVIVQGEVSTSGLKSVVAIARKISSVPQIIPMFKDVASGVVKAERIRAVTIEDLLGREPVNLDCTSIASLLKDKVVMVTGAGGSIGSELCRQILRCAPRLLLMVEQTELVLFEIEQELIEAGHGGLILSVIADVTDEAAMRGGLEQHRPEIIFHAAAHKHVPLMERQPAEAIKNNTFATMGLARMASEFQVGRFVFISTDKAINPTSVMGCSKRLAEKTLQAAQCEPGNRTRFMAVRFGNVLGSSGSVIPTFRRQIAQGGPVTVTHPEMTRYFMTIPEAVGLVLQTATMGTGGEIFILDMGQPVKIIDMARQMIELSGFKVGLDIDIKITGLRPGEKLYEELRHTDETHEATEHARIYKLRCDSAPENLAVWLGELRLALASGAPLEIKQAMKQLVPEYTPFWGDKAQTGVAPADNPPSADPGLVLQLAKGV